MSQQLLYQGHPVADMPREELIQLVETLVLLNQAQLKQSLRRAKEAQERRRGYEANR